ncbi:small subunit ribosomal protein S2 [Rhodobium orientis]|uniref:Small ribosomal subunit protein uS2 n=1 Tax=Rhodobium orientis TaxID=34017 RepID=A0A327JRF8_9HYPH|nr:30S ribosomal protein S2 [Rhodobium orientis]MBB4302438.1 small subunit ribosomal protein S2 [Rhodobium orientis]MBK5949288.1 30S ribosomal protein S2 [Rhodobium orientis]RAI28661.1 30S ribosomal protein S2 [Rhodobium orientis]
MALPDFTMRQLLEAGVHFGHQRHRWNPKMDPFIFGLRNNVHIIDLAQTVPLLHQALKVVSDTVSGGGRVLFVGTKRQAQNSVADAARRSAQYFVNARWLGGMLTNWKTISNSIQRLRKLEEMLDGGSAQALTKKERLFLSREREKLERNLGGIKDMGGIPNLLFVIDTNRESIAIQEARRLNIPVAAILDTNCDPAGIDFPIPGNDDAARAIDLYCDLIARAAIDGIGRAQGSMGVDIGEAEEIFTEEPALADVATEAPATEEVAAEAPTAEEVAAEAPAAEPAAEAASEDAGEEELVALFEAPEGEPDDLKKINGIGPVIETKLNKLGIAKFAQVAGLSAEDIARIDEALAFKGRIEREEWVSQAATLAGADA